MADANEFYSYLSDVRKSFSDFAAGSSTVPKGTETLEQEIELTKLNLLEVCSYVMEKFDPTTTIHQFTAVEMRDFMALLNDIINEHHNVNFEQFYA
jgi:hypothetical protein